FAEHALRVVDGLAHDLHLPAGPALGERLVLRVVARGGHALEVLPARGLAPAAGHGQENPLAGEGLRPGGPRARPGAPGGAVALRVSWCSCCTSSGGMLFSRLVPQMARMRSADSTQAAVCAGSME